MNELQPIIPTQTGHVLQHDAGSPEPTPITDQEVGEYREQDRFLPVSLPAPF